MTTGDKSKPVVDRDSRKYHRGRFTRYARAAYDLQLAGGYGIRALSIENEHDDDRFAFVLAFVILYARPFTKTRGWPGLPTKKLPYTSDERALHTSLLNDRHKIFAHTDAEFYEAMPLIGTEHDDAALHIERKHSTWRWLSARSARALRPTT